MNTSAINAYAKVDLDTSVTAADSHKLILLLYQGAVLAVNSAKIQMSRNDVAAKGKSISHAIMIIDEGLLNSLDKSTGGELGQNLAALYEYMSKRLLVANLMNDVDALDEVARLLSELKAAWEGIRPVTASPAKAEVRPQAAPAKQPALTYGRM